ncbi:MAG: YjjG family noncanonical pyrimidine nucleotidase [Bacteroidales bacterium]|nr:YjjG family noncanonical pyrimidine nucleotidase [Bacteroidales bacterium]
MKYEHIFFDLDRTLWDFEANSIETFKELFVKYGLEKCCIFEDFHKIYREINEQLWKDYRENRISKEKLSWQRFYQTNNHFGLKSEDIAKKMSQDYIEISPTKTLMMPNSIAILDYLSRKYTLHIVTNGFKEVQYRKINNCGIENYFETVFTSEEVGCNKPNPAFFEFVLKTTGANPKTSMVIGDDEAVDIQAAIEANLASIWFNPNMQKAVSNPSYIIKDLLEIKNIL